MLNISLFTLVVPDYDVAIRFYVNQVGFTLLEDTDMGGGKRWVRIAPAGSDTAILIARAVDPRQRAAIGNQTGGRVGFFLNSDDFDRDHARMLANGLEFEEPPRNEPYGKVAVWRDPFGNRWDLLQLKS